MAIPRVKSDGPVAHAQTKKERAQVLQQLYKHLRDEAAALVELSTIPQKAKLRQELMVNGHSLQRTLDTIQRGCE